MWDEGELDERRGKVGGRRYCAVPLLYYIESLTYICLIVSPVAETVDVFERVGVAWRCDRSLFQNGHDPGTWILEQKVRVV